MWGLSPRVRGNLRCKNPHRLLPGPIPAGAGEPRLACRAQSFGWAYPRGCGGTETLYFLQISLRGLSPRVRGNLETQTLWAAGQGPIPAGAGEPASSSDHHLPDRAYPRGCGGTWHRCQLASIDKGLSPRVRGNLLPFRLGKNRPGPIPAGAGEPKFCRLQPQMRGAYPRGCGGTITDDIDERLEEGLSPRVRGNLTKRALAPDESGPIPAGAGEP